MLVELIEDENGELILPIPDEILKSLNLHIDDKIKFSIIDDVITLAKVNQND